MKSFYVFIFCLVAFIPCWGSNSDGWSYKYAVIAPNTRSEYISGSLLYMNKMLSPELTHVVTPIGEFAYVGNMGSPKMGWVPAWSGGKGELFVTGGYKSLTEDALAGKIPAIRKMLVKAPSQESGEACLAGALGTPPNGVGAAWVYAVKQGLWINPAKMDEAIKSKLFKSE